MKATITTIKISVKAWKMLKLIAAHTEEKQYAVLDRLLETELQRIQENPCPPH
jgi:hypothetical protein